jgi:DDE superfamily endonuclease
VEESQDAARTLLGRADPERRQAFVEQLQGLLAGAQRDRHLLVYLDEAHIHQDADLGYGWAERGQRFWVNSSSPGLSARVSFYGLYLYNEGQVRLWPYPRANGEHTMDVLRRLRAEVPKPGPDRPLIVRPLIVLWDGAPYHRAQAVREVASTLGIDLVPLPGSSPDLQPRSDAGGGALALAARGRPRSPLPGQHCQASAEDLTRRVATFEVRINHDPCALADRLWVKDTLNPDEEKLRFST